MQRDQEEDSPKSRPTSRRNSASSRRNSLKKEREKDLSLQSAPSSSNSTPKKMVKPQPLEFLVTGKQLLKRSDRANSLPVTYHRRPSIDSKTKKTEAKRTLVSSSSKSRETSMEDDMSLDLSQVSDFEDTNSKYGIRKFSVLASSTPKPKTRSGSLQQTRDNRERPETRECLENKSRTSTFSLSRDSLYKTSSSASPYRYGFSTDLDSSVSPEYSGQSSTELSPRARADRASQEVHVSSCQSSCFDCSELDTKVAELERSQQWAGGEWNHFWVNYNSSAGVPVNSYYNMCPTPYRTENIEIGDFDLSADGSLKKSPEDLAKISDIIRNEGLHLTPKETQNLIKCAHVLGNVLTKAIERSKVEPQRVKEIADPEILEKKKAMTLNLRDTVVPLEVVDKRETVTTQTDISLPNTKSAPRIFESILRQLSRSSIDEGLEKLGEMAMKNQKEKEERQKREEKQKKEERQKENGESDNKDLAGLNVTI